MPWRDLTDHARAKLRGGGEALAGRGIGLSMLRRLSNCITSCITSARVRGASLIS